MSMEFIRKLPIPMDIKAEYPMTDDLTVLRNKRNEEVKSIFRGETDKLILVIGP